MKKELKILFTLITPLILVTSCGTNETGDNIYLEFTSDSQYIDSAMKESISHTCVFTRDNKVLFDDEKTSSLSWKENDGNGLLIYSDVDTTYVDYFYYSGTFFFYYQLDGRNFTFNAKDTSYLSSLNEDYEYSFNRLASYGFEGYGITPGERTYSSLKLLNDKEKHVILFKAGIGTDPSSVYGPWVVYGKNWKFENNIYSFELEGKTITSLYCDIDSKEGYKVSIDDLELYLTLSDGFEWEDYQDSDFK